MAAKHNTGETSDHKTPFYQIVDGFRIPGFFSPEAFRSALSYKPHPDDLIIVTYPKCGTTWIQNIVTCIFKKGKPIESAFEFFSQTPFLEMAGAEAAEKMDRPGAMKCHLPFHLTPWSPEAKYIFVARNPKDCCVSYYHHTENIAGYRFSGGSFDDYFELFIEGKVDFGDYFDTTMSWYEHRNDPNVLFLTYEELKKDIIANVLKIAEFIGTEYKEAIKDKVLQKVIDHSSFSYMKETLKGFMSDLHNLPREFIQNNPDIPHGLRILLCGEEDVLRKDSSDAVFVRKGIIGDWKNYFSSEQNARLERKFKERMGGTELEELWKNIMNVNSTMPPNPCTQFVDGFQIPLKFSVDAFRSALSYKPRPDDLFLVTYPKCGTTWAQHTLLLIFRQGKPLTSYMEFFSATSFLEVAGAEGAEKMPQPGAIKAHLPYHLTPRSDTAKYIYVTRNPKDCCVSYFHHMRNIPAHAFYETFDEFFEYFITGNIDCGDYFDHLLGWYDHRNDPNVLFLTYEQMKENPEGIILKMASFINDKLYAEPLRNDPEKLKNVVKYSNFDYVKEVVNKEMKKLVTNLPSSHSAKSAESQKKSEFIRKGIIGDWKNYFSEEQSKRLDEKFAEKTKGTDILNFWRKYM